jgi:superfamily II DNA or RNA helicase
VLREYQSSFVSKVEDAARRGARRIIGVLPTGAGKGFVAANIAKGCADKGNESVFFAAQRELIFQMGSQLDRLNVPHYKLMAGVNNEYEGFDDAVASSMTTLAAKDTLWSRGFKRGLIQPPPARLVQIDECHGSITRTYKAIMDHYADSYQIGWSATPCRADGISLSEQFDEMVIGPSYKELQGLGHLVPCKVFAPDRPDLKGMYGKEYSLKELDNRMNKSPLIGSIVNEWMRHSDGRSTVVFASSVDHSLHLMERFRWILGKNSDGSERCEHIDGKMDQVKRDEIMERVKDGSVLVLCNYGVAHTGVDVPRWKYLICARPTRSFSLWRQMGGRIQRPFENHVEAVIQDHSDNAFRFGYPDEDVSWELNTDKKAQDLCRTERNRPPHRPKDEPAPFQCPSCLVPYRGYKCPTCGFVFERRGKDVEMQKGELKELERKKVNAQASHEDKQKYWDTQCLGWAIGTNKKIGAAAYRYKDKFGVFPPHFIQNVPRSTQWRMSAKDFYKHLIKPAQQKLRSDMEDFFNES